MVIHFKYSSMYTSIPNSLSHTVEYYSDIKSNEMILFVETWMELETVILSEVSQDEGRKDG